jgi:hypothetical protein
MFKPLIISIIIILSILIRISYSTWENKQKIFALHNQSYQLAKEYNSIKKKYPYINDVVNLADFYSFSKLLKLPVPTPFDMFDKFLLNLSPSVLIDKIKWELQDYHNIVSPQQHLKIYILIKFIDNNVSIEEAKINLDKYINTLKKDFDNFDVHYMSFSHQITNISNCVIIPAAIFMTK